MSNNIKHKGIIDSITDNCIKVRIVQVSACASCKVSSHCNASESKIKVVDVYGENKGYRVGDSVIIVASNSVGKRAVILGFVIPFLILLISVFLVSFLTGNEPLAALVSILSLVPYYLILFLLKDKIREKISFSIE